ncbi:MAG: helix-turn-helix transcriptional regulator [Lachnospiraceae bacterium]|nr:helix-turn-helix transcriptional regulator [Lachnospiraceae bacterium]MBQ1172106.1 helix-turn-helix transcriptional regulator [Lachnospiraceae bacterium]MEE1250623.1 helix-turn-helix transcriptional regulator [Lachnospiraceae bacterium]
MTLGDKLSKLRKENNYTQEQLADVLGVSRQAISKWESNITYPETEKLIRISELFNCSLDYLLKDAEETIYKPQSDTDTLFLRKRIRERKSEKTVLGMPLWHIGRNARGFIAVGLNARGVIAVGLKARGIVSLGMLSFGVLSLGMLSFGLLSLGMFALGLLSAGCFSIGVFATGAISLGIISLGAIAIGDFSVGALSIGKYFALGDNARAMIALGDTEAAGSVFQKIGELSAQDITAVKQSLDTVVPTYLSWAKEIIKLFL